MDGWTDRARCRVTCMRLKMSSLLAMNIKNVSSQAENGPNFLSAPN